MADIVRRHGELLADHFGEDKGMRDIRKHVAWYLHGFPAGADLRRALALVKTLAELDDLLHQLDPDVPFPDCGRGPAGPAGLPRFGDTSRGLADRSGRLHGALRCRRHALRRLTHRTGDSVPRHHRDATDTSPDWLWRGMSQYDGVHYDGFRLAEPSPCC